MKEKFCPLHDRVAVRRLEVAQKTTSGVFLPDDAQEKPARGIVVATGPGYSTSSCNQSSKSSSTGEGNCPCKGSCCEGVCTPLQVKVGDEVLFGKWSGTEMKIDGEELLIMKESDILGIFKK